VVKVEFHTGLGDVSDKLDFACRLLRKAQTAGGAVVVGGERALLDRLDVALWTFEALSFVPHARLRAGVEPGPLHGRTPLWLADEPGRCPRREVLVNLGPRLAEGWDRFERVIELVDASDLDRASGRERWRTYAARPGIELVHHARGGAAT
jgi:DNA polymerase-3 subunit chi